MYSLLFDSWKNNFFIVYNKKSSTNYMLSVSCHRKHKISGLMNSGFYPSYIVLYTTNRNNSSNINVRRLCLQNDNNKT